VHQLYSRVATGYYVVATAFLLVLAVVLLLAAVWEAVAALLAGEVVGVLEGVGLVIIGFAIIETAKFIAEEEVLRDKELRSAVESRRSLTKFITIVVIAASLEALVMVFETGRTDVTKSVYPALLFAAAMFALLALGGFQWLSSRIAPPPGNAEDSIDHREPPEEAVAPAIGETGAEPAPPEPASGPSPA
jgi:hypothetical protein